jgi:hypothetical protein
MRLPIHSGLQELKDYRFIEAPTSAESAIKGSKGEKPTIFFRRRCPEARGRPRSKQVVPSGLTGDPRRMIAARLARRASLSRLFLVGIHADERIGRARTQIRGADQNETDQTKPGLGKQAKQHDRATRGKTDVTISIADIFSHVHGGKSCQVWCGVVWRLTIATSVDKLSS